MNLELSTLFVHIPFFIVNIYFECQVYNYVQERQKYDKMSQILKDNVDNAIAIPEKTAKLKIRAFFLFLRRVFVFFLSDLQTGM